ncbi:Uncharacterised protein [Bordetella pertussis]|nr:Uncharacterised protein [Bordetella pertussis]
MEARRSAALASGTHSVRVGKQRASLVVQRAMQRMQRTRGRRECDSRCGHDSSVFRLGRVQRCRNDPQLEEGVTIHSVLSNQ